MADVVANMAGSIWKKIVTEGDTVNIGQDVVILESMKMEIPISTPVKGKVTTFYVKEGDFVNEGDLIAVVEEE
ncbi:acetyl-CoA carboxylase biotin carboxyl carrier protein subunit [Bacillaceae bacterium S4-13-58]